VINTLHQNFSSGADYFKSLVNVFAPEYRSAANAHLKNFYLIVPALTLTHIESISGDKER
jgi:WASH complex subunit 7